MWVRINYIAGKNYHVLSTFDQYHWVFTNDGPMTVLKTDCVEVPMYTVEWRNLDTGATLYAKEVTDLSTIKCAKDECLFITRE